MDKITHIVCSPVRRTLDAALLSFAPLFIRGLQMTVFGSLREFGDSPASTGSALGWVEENVCWTAYRLDMSRRELGEKVSFWTNRAAHCRDHRSLESIAQEALQERREGFQKGFLPPKMQLRMSKLLLFPTQAYLDDY
jgi:hypothetical protein